MATPRENEDPFVIDDNGLLHGTLPTGLKIGEVVHKQFVMREALLEDLLKAEEEADVTTPLAFNAVLATLQLTSVGTFEGPFTLNMLGRIKPADWRMLRAAQARLDALGEADSGVSATS